ncbi:hypothetical protein WDU94_003418 [Cyamophila willieti]
MAYLKLFVEPDSEELQNTPIGPTSWHVKKTLDILKMWGKSGEEHTITTEDGYILSLFRITPLKEKATPVLFLHGLLAAPETWLMRGKDDLAIILNEKGYDVWLGCYRGSTYGRRHVNLTTADEKFWDFSFHEHGLYDAPKMIDHILAVTGLPKTAVIAHSMGNAVFMSMIAMRPEYNDKVHLFISMAPYAVVQMELSSRVEALFTGVMPILRKNIQTDETLDFSYGGRSTPWPEFNTARKMIPVLTAYVPSGSSPKCVEHLFQLRKGQFRQFDYGSARGNLAHYKQTEPPVYNLSLIQVPVSLYYGEKDTRVSKESMPAQAQALPNVVRSCVIPGFTHVDFIIASNARQLLYDPILEDLRKYAPTNR